MISFPAAVWSKTPNGEFRITDWRGAEQSNGAAAPVFQATTPLVPRLQGNQEMLNFQVRHEVELRGPILEDAKANRPAEMKDAILYLFRTCWKRGTNTLETTQPKP